jgi:hypothetical protein
MRSSVNTAVGMRSCVLVALVGLAVALSATAYTAPARAQNAPAKIQKKANETVKKDCDDWGSIVWICGTTVHPLLSLVGKSWTWGGDLIYLCKVVCLDGYNKVCAHTGAISTRGRVLSHKTGPCSD